MLSRFGRLWLFLIVLSTSLHCVTSDANISLSDDIGDGADPRVDYVRINLTTPGCANASFEPQGPLTAPFEFSTGVTPDCSDNVSYAVEFDGCQARIEYNTTAHPNPTFSMRFSRASAKEDSIEMRGVNGARLTFSVKTDSFYVRADTQLGVQASNPMTCIKSTAESISKERVFHLSLCHSGDPTKCEIYAEVPSNAGSLLVEHTTRAETGSTSSNAGRPDTAVRHDYWLASLTVFISGAARLFDLA